MMKFEILNDTLKPNVLLAAVATISLSVELGKQRRMKYIGRGVRSLQISITD